MLHVHVQKYYEIQQPKILNQGAAARLHEQNSHGLGEAAECNDAMMQQQQLPHANTPPSPSLSDECLRHL